MIQFFPMLQNITLKMNKSSVAKHKSSKSKKKSNQAEVFVLPPNLLEQLGINLGNIETASESTWECQEQERDYLLKETAHQYKPTLSPNSTENHLNTTLEKESSIIQAANLMKKSVFLSPTFISNNNSNIEGEFEVIENNYVDKAIPKINEYNLGNCEETEETFFVLPAAISNSDYQNNSSVHASISMQDAIKKEQTSEEVEKIKHNNIWNTLYGEHADEAYSSDCSNSNIDKSDVLNSSGLYGMKQNIKKINIISEQIINPSQCQNTNKCSPIGNNLVHVTVDTVVKCQHKNNISYKNNVIIGPDLITDFLKPTEMFDGANIYFPTEVGNTFFNANETVPEEIENKQCNNVSSNKNILVNIQMQDVLNHDNQSLRLFTRETQQNDVGAVHLCAADNVEQSKSVESGVLIEKFNRATAARDVFEAGKVSYSLENHNIISSHGDNSSIAYTLPNEVSDKCDEITTLIQYPIEEGTQKCSEDVPAEDDIINRDDSNNSCFIKHCNETKLNIDKDQKLQYVKGSNNNIKSTKSILEKGTDKNKSTCPKKRKNVDKQDLKLNNIKSSSRDGISTENFLDHNTNTKIQLQKLHKIPSKNVDKDDLIVKNYKSSSYIMSTDTTINNRNTEIQVQTCSNKSKKRCSKIQNNTHKQDIQLKNDKSASDVISTESIVSKNTNSKIQAKQCTDEYESQCSTMQNVDKQDLKLRSNERNSSEILSLKSIIYENTNTEIQIEKCTDRYKSECSKIPNNVDKRYLNLKDDKNSRSDVISTKSICNTNTHVKEKCADKYVSQCSIKQKTDERNASKILNSINYTCRKEERERKRKRLKSDSIENAADVEIEKVKEIVKYLSQYAEIQKRNTYNVRYDGNSIKNNDAAKCKLSVQGVKNPDSSVKKMVCARNKDLKTYERKNKRVLTVKNKSDWYKYVNIPIQEINISDGNTSDTCKENERCLCEDFGRLIFYNKQNTHESICFRSKAEHICTPDVIFSIYNEDAFSANSYDCKLNEWGVEEMYIAGALKEKKSFDDNGPIYTVKGKTNSSNISEQISPEAPKRKSSLTFLEHDSGEPSMKKCRDTVFSSNHTEVVKDHKSAEVEKSRNVHVDTSPEHVSEVESDINGVLIVHDCGTNEATVDNDLIKCGVCEESMQFKDWIGHIELKHNYLAWKHGERALDFGTEKTVREHLSYLLKEIGKLKCTKCGLVRKHVKSYLTHVQRCDGFNESHNASVLDTSTDTVSQTVSIRNTRMAVGNDSETEAAPVNRELMSCGVCQESMSCSDWLSHLESQHQYMAWKIGEPALDVNNEEAVREHLYDLSKKLGGLKCAKCGVIRKYVKSYLTHIEDCNGLNESIGTSAFGTSSDVNGLVGKTGAAGNDNKTEVAPVQSDIIICGVCQDSMRRRDWQSHIESKHQYIAWKSGDPALDVNDEEAVRTHFYDLLKEFGGLKCAKCGVIRKYVKLYLSHIQSCNGSSESQNNSSINDVSGVVSGSDSAIADTSLGAVICNKNQIGDGDEFVKCGLCEESVKGADWLRHIESQHEYLAWKHGEPILDVNSMEAVHAHLYDITKKHGALKCSKCGLARKYVKSYITHIRNCNGPNESRDDSELNTSSFAMEKESKNRVSDVAVDVGQTVPENQLVNCGVCGEPTQAENWILHIKTRHNYLAWKSEEPALDVNDEEAVREHLYDISKEYDGLECSKCGVKRRYVKSYLTHFNSCSESNRKEPHSDRKSSKCNILLDVESSSSKLGEALVKCGVCGQYMLPKDWMAHIADKHNYLAWKAGDPPLDIKEKVEVRYHLQKLVEKYGPLKCCKCGLRRKYVKNYMRHINMCHDSENSLSDSSLSAPDMNSSEMAAVELITSTSGTEQVKCGVCGEILENSLWTSHIADQHKYLAWKEGDTPLDVNDNDEVRRHLKSINKKNGKLICKSCGKKFKLVINYLRHMGTCDQDGANGTADQNASCVDFDSGGTCGVCREAVAPGNWIQHTQREHNYLAWREGEKPWDLDDFTEVNEHLYVISKNMNGLICNKCGLARKYVKTYLTHIKNCTGTDADHKFSLPDDTPLSVQRGPYQCAMCKQKIEPAQWKQHAMKEHYNITWIVGQTPIDVKNPYAVEKYLKEYKSKQHAFKCKCGATRISCAGFYAHIITCGKSEEEIEMFKSICEICNNSYLCIYKNQHMAIHRVQEYTKELKLKKLQAEKKGEKEVEEVLITPGKRRAAQKARSVIENYTNDLDQSTYKCESCGIGMEFREQLKAHNCETYAEADFSGESSSAEEPSGDDSDESSADSDASADAQREDARERHKSTTTSKVPKLPFKVTNRTAFLLQADEDFCNTHFTDDTLFPQWHSRELEVVSECDLSRYLPPIEQSCKFKTGSDWTTLKRFEAVKGDGCVLFTGACIVTIAWIPLRVEEIFGGGKNYLAVVCHNGIDDPRYLCDETPSHENLIQIWEFSTFLHQTLPKIVLGIAHDFGTVWSMDWCPSGAKDLLPEDPEGGQAYRLGLLAVACSNGSCYIFSVPYPSTVVQNDMFVYKLKPVAELRMSTSSTRKLFQATSITWSKEKGHKIVLVGYADGSTAYYDLTCDSPLLRVVQNEVDVLFPYHDERPLNSSITATDMYPSALGAAGAVVAAGVSGSELSAARRGAGGARARVPAAAAAAFAPHWPAAVLAGNVAVMSKTATEVEWGGAGRRLGLVRAAAGCARCGAVLAAAPPTLRLLRTHPVYPDVKRRVVGMLELARLDNKRQKRVNDELGIQIEPLTYTDTVQKYGIEFRVIREVNRTVQRGCTSKPCAHCPERFPLADIKAMAFCPSWKYHNRLALATHSGVIFLMRVAS